MRKSPLLPVIYTLLTAFFVSLASNAICIGDISSLSWDIYRVFALVGSVLGVAVFSFLAYRERERLLPFRVLSQTPASPCKGLVLLLTKSSVPIEKFGDFSFPLSFSAEDGSTMEICGNDLQTDINNIELNKKKFFWNWQQFMRALALHINKGGLSRVVIVGSCDKDGESGSDREFNQARTLINQYAPNVVVEQGMSADFEDLNSLTRSISKALGTLAKGTSDGKYPKLDHKDIIVDVTGGQKVASIAGAMVTLSSSVRFQYVSTTGKPGPTKEDPKQYDIIAFDIKNRADVSAD